MRIYRLFLALVVLSFLCATNALAGYGTDITIYDNKTSDSIGWYNRGTTPGEDQEVEPGMTTGQAWDLEGFFLKDGRYLSMIGGFNFQYGVPGYNLRSGDIFIDTTGDAKYGAAGASTLNGYDYVVDMNWETLTYNVYQLSGSSILADVLYYNQYGSSPWNYDHARNTGDSLITTGTFTFTNGLSDSNTGFQGGTHYAVEGIDLSSFLASGTTFVSHFTMECGNDNLMGHGTTVPEPTTVLLLGFGLLGLGVSSRKLKK